MVRRSRNVHQIEQRLGRNFARGGLSEPFVPRGLMILLLALALALSAAPAFGWSLSKELVHPSLRAARDDLRKCAAEHGLADGRYAVWIVVGATGRGRVAVREAPVTLEPDARRCIVRAFERQKYPTPLGATVAWSAASPPGRTYSIAYPFQLAVQAYGFDAAQGPPRRVRPKPARAGRIRAIIRR